MPDAFQLLISGAQFALTFGIYTSWKSIKRIEEDNKKTSDRMGKGDGFIQEGDENFV
jgi:hypothetical protein